MSTLEVTNFSNVIKEEVISEFEATLLANNYEADFKIDVKEEPVVKEETNTSWYETTCIVEKGEDDVFLGKPINVFNARVIIDRIPDSILRRYLKSEIKTIENHEKSTEEFASSIVADNCTEIFPGNLKNTVSRNGADSNKIERVLESNTYWKICKTCNVKNRTNTQCRCASKCLKCETPLIFQCEKCQRHLATVATMKKHLSLKCDLKRGYYYKCFECDYQSRYRISTRSHVQHMHPTMTSQMYRIETIKSDDVLNDLDNAIRKKLKCSKCGLEFDFLTTLMKHVQICTEKCNFSDDIFVQIKPTRGAKEQYKCPECVYESSAFKNLCSHYSYMHMTKSHSCTKCGKKFDNRLSSRKHFVQCGLQIQYNCDHCSFKSHHRNIFTNHILRRHVVGNEIECPTCKKTFKNSKCLKIHQRRCERQPNMECGHCSFKTKDRGTLIRHLLAIHSIDKEMECPICKKVLRNEQRLKNHLKRCRLDYSQCKYCSYKTKSTHLLRLHTLRLHANSRHISNILEELKKYGDGTLKEYRCDHCSYKSYVKHNMYSHIVKNHLKEKNTKSSKCGDEFRNSVYLQAPLQYCGLKSYLHCEHCSFKTYLKGGLTQHVKRHRNTSITLS